LASAEIQLGWGCLLKPQKGQKAHLAFEVDKGN